MSHFIPSQIICLERQNKSLFCEVIEIISSKVESLFPKGIEKQYRAVSGGQRRDWIFSGPVASKLGIQHISLYKDGSLEVLDHNGDLVSRNIKNLYVVHVVDLITEGSSVYRLESGRAHGWIPMLRDGGAHVNDLVAVVTRLQGGEERLSEQGVNVHSFVTIDKDFVSKHSSNSERALSYMKNPHRWCCNFIKQNGALHLVDSFDPNANKLDRARDFVARYQQVLEKYGHLKQLESTVKRKYNITLRGE
jgi:hypothetical protein